MKEIQLTHNYVALVDDDDYDRVSKHKWWVHKFKDVPYAEGLIEGSYVLMHRFVMNVVDSKIFVDHRFHNTLDNQKENLRLCSSSLNQANSRKNKGVSSSKFKGVHFRKDSKMWTAYITKDGTRLYLGNFSSQEAAAIAYNKATLELNGEFALPNELTKVEEASALIPAINRFSSAYKGCHWHKRLKKWAGYIKHDGVAEHLGYFDNEKDAALAFNKRAIELRGDKARVNIFKTVTEPVPADTPPA